VVANQLVESSAPVFLMEPVVRSTVGKLLTLLHTTLMNERHVEL